MAQQLEDICADINSDNEICLAVLTGAGDKAFCTGSEAEADAAAAVAGIDRPVIAAVNGDALGEGLEIALACDIRIASEKARFGLPQLAAGIIPMNGGTQRLPRLIGRGMAMDMILTAGVIDAAEACRIGLLSKVVPAEQLAAEADAIAGKMAAQAPISLRYVKEAVNKGLDMTLEQGLRLEADLYLLLHTTKDRTEGITAFLAKRKAEFKGE
jgi:enoyl-CoA hydratase/carnithine racemase